MIESLLVEVLIERKLWRAGDLFVIEDEVLEKYLLFGFKSVVEIMNSPEYEAHINHQNLVEICLTRFISAIKALDCLNKYVDEFTDILNVCLAHQLHQRLSPFAKLASDILNFLFLNYKKLVDFNNIMNSAMKFLFSGNKSIVNNLSNFISLVVNDHLHFFVDHLEEILRSILCYENYSLISLLPILYIGDETQLITRNIKMLLSDSILMMNMKVRSSLVQLVICVYEKQPVIIEENVDFLLKFLYFADSTEIINNILNKLFQTNGKLLNDHVTNLMRIGLVVTDRCFILIGSLIFKISCSDHLLARDCLVYFVANFFNNNTHENNNGQHNNTVNISSEHNNSQEIHKPSVTTSSNKMEQLLRWIDILLLNHPQHQQLMLQLLQHLETNNNSKTNANLIELKMHFNNWVQKQQQTFHDDKYSHNVDANQSYCSLAKLPLDWSEIQINPTITHKQATNELWGPAFKSTPSNNGKNNNIFLDKNTNKFSHIINNINNEVGDSNSINNNINKNNNVINNCNLNKSGLEPNKYILSYTTEDKPTTKLLNFMPATTSETTTPPIQRNSFFENNAFKCSQATIYDEVYDDGRADDDDDETTAYKYNAYYDDGDDNNDDDGGLDHDDNLCGCGDDINLKKQKIIGKVPDQHPAYDSDVDCNNNVDVTVDNSHVIVSENNVNDNNITITDMKVTNDTSKGQNYTNDIHNIIDNNLIFDNLINIHSVNDPKTTANKFSNTYKYDHHFLDWVQHNLPIPISLTTESNAITVYNNESSNGKNKNNPEHKHRLFGGRLNADANNYSHFNRNHYNTHSIASTSTKLHKHNCHNKLLLQFQCSSTNQKDACAFKSGVTFKLVTNQPLLWLTVSYLHCLFTEGRHENQDDETGDHLGNKGTCVDESKLQCWRKLEDMEHLMVMFNKSTRVQLPTIKELKLLQSELSQKMFFNLFMSSNEEDRWECFVCNNQSGELLTLDGQLLNITGDLKVKRGRHSWLTNLKPWKHALFTICGSNVGYTKKDNLIQLNEIVKIKTKQHKSTNNNINNNNNNNNSNINNNKTIVSLTTKKLNIYNDDNNEDNKHSNNKKFIFKFLNSNEALKWIRCLHVAMAITQSWVGSGKVL